MSLAAILAALGPLKNVLAPTVFEQMLRDVAPPHVLNEMADNAMLTNRAIADIGRKAMKKELFTVYEVNNGFLAELTSAGDIVVSDTLSGVCSDAQAACAARAVAGDKEEDPVRELGKKAAAWLKLP